MVVLFLRFNLHGAAKNQLGTAKLVTTLHPHFFFFIPEIMETIISLWTIKMFIVIFLWVIISKKKISLLL